MSKLLRQILFCAALVAFVWFTAVVMDREFLNEKIIRFHVVANSDAEEDQEVKLRVRDAIITGIKDDLSKITDVSQAKAYLQENLPRIERIAEETLRTFGFDDKVMAALCKEAFDTRVYDTFALPAGVYEALRITIGEGEGRNWWCVAFPQLCFPATSQSVTEVAASAGFSDTIQSVLTGREGYHLRFYLLDVLGKMENMLFAG